MSCEIRMRGKGRRTVKVTCDDCKQTIVKWQEGVLYRDDPSEEMATIHYVHVGTCEEWYTKDRTLEYMGFLDEHFAEYKVKSLRQGLKDVQEIRSKDGST